MKTNLYKIIVLAGISLTYEVRGAIAADFLVIANPSIPLTSIAKSDVKQELLANKTTWPDGKKVSIITLSPDAPEEDAISNEYMNMTAAQAKKHWLKKVFSNDLAGQPPAFDTAQEVVEKVATTPGAIAVVPKGTDPGKAKVLTETP